MSGCTARWFEWRRASLHRAVGFAVWGYDAKWILKRIQDKSVTRGEERLFFPLSCSGAVCSPERNAPWCGGGSYSRWLLPQKPKDIAIVPSRRSLLLCRT